VITSEVTLTLSRATLLFLSPSLALCVCVRVAHCPSFPLPLFLLLACLQLHFNLKIAKLHSSTAVLDHYLYV
jgi:hypothetical protein